MALNKILLVDDSKMSRDSLCEILKVQYTVETVQNGEDALKRLRQDDIALILLDLVMPIMDGWEFLRRYKQNVHLNGIPVVVITEREEPETEYRALQMGAHDFVHKTDCADVIRLRVQMAIQYSRSASYRRLRYLAEYDSLTGLYNRTALFEAVGRILDDNPDTKFAFVCFDIDRFRLVNNFFGAEEGNRLLCYCAARLAQYAQQYGPSAYGRIERDIFGICIPYTPRMFEEMESIRTKLMENHWNYTLVPSFGVYVIDDRTLPPERMYDRACAAAETRKGDFFRCYAVYTDKMEQRLREQQAIQNEMNSALDKGQFVVYLQPKYSLQSNSFAGSEALVRWEHPETGLIPPGKFIPLFEENGFITRLDFYVWEQVCRILSDWIAAGKAPLPISVNISRSDLCDLNIAKRIIALAKQYRIPPRLLNLEITESAYTSNPELVKTITATLQLSGFVVMMDDFGSGYSSLNMLKDINIDVMKLDMRFFSGAADAKRGENIVAAMIRMAKWLHIPVIAEGVETAEQVDFLRHAGCEYVQGYYYGKPAPVKEYEEVLSDGERAVPAEQKLLQKTTDFGAMVQRIFSELCGCRALGEFDGSSLQILQADPDTGKLWSLLKDSGGSAEYHWESIPADAREKLLSALFKAQFSRGTALLEQEMRTGEGTFLYLEVEVRYLRASAEKCFVLLTFNDITAEKAVLKQDLSVM